MLDLRKHDIDFRVATKLPDSTFVAQKLLSFYSQFYCSKQYLKKNGKINSLSDLAKRKVAHYAVNKNMNDLEIFHHKKKSQLKLINALSISQATVIKNLVTEGVCIGVLPNFFDEDPAMINVLPDYQMYPRNLYAIYNSKQFLSHRARLFLERVKEYCELRTLK